MDKKNIKKIKTGFIPVFQLLEKHQLLSNSSDELIFISNYLNYEISGEKFIACANVNPQVKIMTGYLSECEKKYIPTEVYYSSRFISRDVLAALEIFSKSDFISLKKIEYIEKDGGENNDIAQNEIKNYSDILSANGQILNNKTMQYLAPILFNKIDGLLLSDRQFNNFNFASPEKNIYVLIILGTALPGFADIYDFLKDKNCFIFYFEYLELMFSSIEKENFTEKKYFDIEYRQKKITQKIDLLENFIKSNYFEKTYGSNKNVKIKILHFFPKFSHYEIEDSYFNKKITGPYLSLEYAGGAYLSLRDKIRIEAFLN